MCIVLLLFPQQSWWIRQHRPGPPPSKLWLDTERRLRRVTAEAVFSINTSRSFSGEHRRSQMSVIGLWLLQAWATMESLTCAVLEWWIIPYLSSVERKVSSSVFPPFVVHNLFSHILCFVAFKDSHKIMFISVTQRWEPVGVEGSF